jgi:hypothetical protein
VTSFASNGIAYDRGGPRGELPIVLIHAYPSRGRGYQLLAVECAMACATPGINIASDSIVDDTTAAMYR